MHLFSVLLSHDRLTIHVLVIADDVFLTVMRVIVFHRLIDDQLHFSIVHLHLLLLLLLLLVLSEDFLLLHCVVVSVSFGLLWIVLVLFLVLIAVYLHLLLLILHLLLLHRLLLHLQVIHILYIFGILHLCRGHGERFFVEEGDDTLLAQHQLNHSFSFVLIKFIFFIETALATGSSHSTIDARGLRWCHEVDSDAKARLRRVHLHLGVSLVVFAF